MSQPTTEVLIVGAGPTGLMLACDLHRRHVPFRIIDRAERPSNHSRAVNIQARTLEAFDDLGVVEYCFERGLLTKAVRTYRDGRLEDSYPLNPEPSNEIPYPYLLILEQHVTEQILSEYLLSHGVPVERGVELRRLTADPDQVKSLLQTPDGEVHLRSSYVVGCDGANSTVRSLAGIKMDEVKASVVYRLADVEIQWDIPHQEIIRFPHENFEFLAIPLPGKKRYRLSLWESLPEGTSSEQSGYGALDKPPTVEEMEKRLFELAPGPVKLLSSRPPMSYRTGLGMASTVLRGRVLLAGDSAHLTPQCTSQGMNLGLHDAYNLGWKLGLVIKGDAPQELLESYKVEREQVAREILELAKSEPSLLGRATHFESRAALDQWSQLGLHYRASPLSLESPSHLIQAGDRAPDGELAIDGNLSHLYDLMDGLSHHLVAFSDGDDPDLETFLTEVEKLYAPMVRTHRVGLGFKASTDVSRRLHRAFGANHGDMVLVRPDRFVGARGSLAEGQAILSHLAGYLIPRAYAQGSGWPSE
jgi:2-polyprenyl-6-methoxyphenol hydroxylase-like FAD-dependent oxidoreductase